MCSSDLAANYIMRLAQVAVYDQKKAAYLGDKILESSNFGAGWGESNSHLKFGKLAY